MKPAAGAVQDIIESWADRHRQIAEFLNKATRELIDDAYSAGYAAGRAAGPAPIGPAAQARRRR